MRGAKPAKSIAPIHKVMRNEHGNVVVRHPKLPGPHMMQPQPDYMELPSGSVSPHSMPGGITGGLGPFESEEGAEGGEYQNQ